MGWSTCHAKYTFRTQLLQIGHCSVVESLTGKWKCHLKTDRSQPSSFLFCKLNQQCCFYRKFWANRSNLKSSPSLIESLHSNAKVRHLCIFILHSESLKVSIRIEIFMRREICNFICNFISFLLCNKNMWKTLKN